MNKKTDSVVSIIFSIIVLPVLMVLTVASFLQTGYNVDLYEFVIYRYDNILLNILGWGIFTGFVFAFSFVLGKMNRRLQIITVSLIILVFAVIWISITRTSAEADQNYIAIYAEVLNEGIYTSLGVDGYLSIYRQQLGLVTILRGIYKIFGEYNYTPFKYIVAAFLPLMVIGGDYITYELSDGSEKACRYYLVILLTFFPLLFYTPFVYGDLISVIFITVALACILKSAKKINIVYVIILFVAFFLAVWTRENSLIVILAAIIAVFFSKEFTLKRKILLIVVMLGAAFLPGEVNNMIYGKYIPKNADSMPAILHITMGMQMNLNAGWYNGYNISTFEKYGCDAKAASKVAFSDAKNLLDNFVDAPQYAFSFYKDKIESQWNVPMMSALEMNRSFAQDAPKIVASVYYGKLHTVIYEFMNIWQLFAYANTLFFGIGSFKKKSMLHNILLIGILGGFMFSLLWEAKTRYVLGYVILMIPCAACGFIETETLLKERIFNKFIRMKKQKKV